MAKWQIKHLFRRNLGETTWKKDAFRENSAKIAGRNKTKQFELCKYSWSRIIALDELPSS